MNLALIITGLLFTIAGVLFLTLYSDRQLTRIFRNVIRPDDEFLQSVDEWVRENRRATIFGCICLSIGFIAELLGNILTLN